MNLLSYQSFYLVGIKGVAMTALAQCLVDAGKKVRGSDVPEQFVTQGILEKLGISIDNSFATVIPADCDCVIYTAAHHAQQNPQVIAAIKREIETVPHAVALAELFNAKKGIAVCGVGGKSTTSAMISWILDKVHQADPDKEISFAVGVGNIPGLNKTGQWTRKSEYFVAEADEYVTDPSAPSRGEAITPRFSFLQPFITVCTNLEFDHPDVYTDFEHTKAVYGKFFDSIKNEGSLIINIDNADLLELAQTVILKNSNDRQLLSFGKSSAADLQLLKFETEPGITKSLLKHKETDAEYLLTLKIPGEYNAMNAMAAILAVQQAGVSIKQAIAALADFNSTLRRAEFIGEKNGVTFYDDYAHHPDEISKVIHAFREWYPGQKLVVAFQSHTFSRTKALFNEFISAFAEADAVYMIDIFASAREKFDDSISSDLLCDEISKKFPQIEAQNFKTVPLLARHLKEILKKGDVCLTIGAGNIYQVHELL